MILRDCDTCERRTDHDRRQWADADGEAVTIHTEYTCTQFSTVTTQETEFPTRERQTHRT